MAVENCYRCHQNTDTDEDHKCTHGMDCEMNDGNRGDCRPECHKCAKDEEVSKDE
jgi:hypothetical protein